MNDLDIFYEGQLIQYQWTKSGKWYDGRIKRIEYIPDMISHYQVEKFVLNAKQLNWQTIIEGIDRGRDKNFIDTNGEDIYKFEDAWVTVKWFSKNYIRPIN